MAFVNGNEQGMGQHFDWTKGKTDEYRASYWATQARSFSGQWDESNAHWRRATDLAHRAEAKEVEASYTAEQAMRAAWLRQFSHSLTFAQSALKTERNRNVLTRAAFAFALAGEVAKAQALIQELEQKHPKDTMVNQVWLPEIKAAIELRKNNAQTALELLEPARRYESAAAFSPQTLRSLVYLKLGQGAQAAAEARKILDHRGQGPLSLLWPLAHLTLARAAVMEGDMAQARKSYQDFFTLWKDADHDMPILIEAKQEFEKIK